MTVSEVADRYGVSAAFMAQALATIGCRNVGPDDALSAATVARFEMEWGDKVRAARPKPEPDFTAESDSVPPRVSRQPKPHVMRVAHAKVTAERDVNTREKVKALLDDPGVVHAIDAAGTRDGDPWRGEVVPGAVHFYSGLSNSGPYAACGRARVRAVLGDEFVPEDDAAAAGQCPRCAQLVADGKAFRSPPLERPDPFCSAFLRLEVGGRVTVKECRQRNFHRGPHRTFDGATWERGAEDYVPAPSD